jgi:hypothetical protein
MVFAVFVLYVLFWIHMAEKRGKCRAFVNTAMNLWVPKSVGKFLRAERPVASQDGLSFVELVSQLIS